MIPTHDEYRRARPFPHAVIDGALPDELCAAAVRAWPDIADPRWQHFDDDHERGKSQMAEPKARACRELIDVMCREQFVGIVERITGYRGLIPGRLGGGLHQTVDGGYLDVHTDFERDEDGLVRRVNALLFLNADWSPACHGELWLGQGVPGWGDSTMIAPTFNRLVVFGTDAASHHGHPVAWSGPTPRRSVAIYYYTCEPIIDAPTRGTTWL